MNISLVYGMERTWGSGHVLQYPHLVDVMKILEKIQTVDSVAATQVIAESIGHRLQGGEVIELVSDLGGGKTTFTKGLAVGFGSSDPVASPTFTVSRVYTAGHKQMHHFDFYRLGEGGMAGLELQELLCDPDVVVVVEWGGVVEDVLPLQRVTIRIDKLSDTSRQICLRYPETLDYVMEDI